MIAVCGAVATDLPESELLLRRIGATAQTQVGSRSAEVRGEAVGLGPLPNAAHMGGARPEALRHLGRRQTNTVVARRVQALEVADERDVPRAEVEVEGRAGAVGDRADEH